MSSGNSVKIGRLFYTFPVGDSLSVTAGWSSVPTMDDMYAGYATYYPSDLLLDFFTYGGAYHQQPGLHSALVLVLSTPSVTAASL